jgi:hypothetical protein
MEKGEQKVIEWRKVSTIKKPRHKIKYPLKIFMIFFKKIRHSTSLE